MRCRLSEVGASLWKDRGDVALNRCATCGLISGQPSRAMPSEERYRDCYGGVVPASPDARYREWLARPEAEVGRGRLLEVGALQAIGPTVFSGDVTAVGYSDNRFDIVVSLECV